MTCSVCGTTEGGFWACPAVMPSARLCEPCCDRFNALVDDASVVILQAMTVGSFHRVVKLASNMGDWVPHPQGQAGLCVLCGQAVPIDEAGLLIAHPFGKGRVCSGSGKPARDDK